ncbi:hypothetical protein ETAA8_05520 [Anatilimnocola aggregata]|uniref:Uncharacterized protein n=1 Tax=Anatilimnocola aggregata TaxID=2528021 RepID=A0A517Y5G5_9BACT|nr:hypothetical protein [Anatilimnocola aggregata]QDU25484.1 hypothetical protein ETAA8_05520 [Anatilimnocola aggregata]
MFGGFTLPVLFPLGSRWRTFEVAMTDLSHRYSEFVTIVVDDEITDLGRPCWNAENLCRVSSPVQLQNIGQKPEEHVRELG